MKKMIQKMLLGVLLGASLGVAGLAQAGVVPSKPIFVSPVGGTSQTQNISVSGGAPFPGAAFIIRSITVPPRFTKVGDTCTGSTLLFLGLLDCDVALQYEAEAVGTESPDPQLVFNVDTTPFNSSTATTPVPVDMTAIGTNGGVLSISPYSWDFGDVLVNNLSTPRPFTVTNIGNGPIRIDAVTPAVVPFVFSNTSCAVGNVLNPGGTCGVSVTYSPTTAPSNDTDNFIIGYHQTFTGDMGTTATFQQQVSVTGRAVTDMVDLSVTKSCTTTNGTNQINAPTANNAVTCTISIKNENTVLNVTNVNLRDFISGPFAINGVPTVVEDGASADCTNIVSNPPNFVEVNCKDITINAGNTATVTVVGGISQPGVVTNTATVSDVNTGDPIAINNVATASVYGIAGADLRITKTVVTPQPVNVNDVVTYEIAVTNVGPQTANTVRVSDIQQGPFVLPVALGVNCNEGGSVSCSSNGLNMSCNLPNLSASQTCTFQYTATVTGPGTWFNVATASSDVFDPILSNNTTGANVAVVAIDDADLSVTKVASVGGNPVTEVKAGTVIDYTLTITNNGPVNPALNVTLTDVITGPFTVISAASPSQGSCQPISQGQLSCQLGTVTTALPVTITYSVTTDADVNASGQNDLPSINNSVFVGTSVNDPNTLNNVASSIVKIIPASADLKVSASVKDEPVLDINGGEDVTLAIVVTNNGPDTAKAAKLTHTMPTSADSTFVVKSVSASNGGTCSNTLPVVCNLGDLTSGQSVTINLVIHTDVAQAAGQAIASSIDTVTSATFDPDLSNNSVTPDTLTYFTKPGFQGGSSGGSTGGCSMSEGNVQNYSLIFFVGSLIAVAMLRRRVQ